MSESVRWLRVLNERDRDIAEDDDAEEARATADYERWLARSFTGEGYDEPDPAFDPDDRADRLEAEGGVL